MEAGSVISSASQRCCSDKGRRRDKRSGRNTACSIAGTASKCLLSRATYTAELQADALRTMSSHAHTFEYTQAQTSTNRAARKLAQGLVSTQRLLLIGHFLWSPTLHPGLLSTFFVGVSQLMYSVCMCVCMCVMSVKLICHAMLVFTVLLYSIQR